VPDRSSESDAGSERDTRERLGRRIADHRAKLGWTQQQLAERLAVSRVAVSHLESGSSTPGERTVALLAGLFKMAPHDLVAGTDYPTAKVDRLPLVVTQHTEVELQLALFDNDVGWFDAVPPARAEVALDRWDVTFRFLRDASHDAAERSAIDAARRRIGDLRIQIRSG
jgi:transcriptional regulator with XRE-family HTH domain